MKSLILGSTAFLVVGSVFAAPVAKNTDFGEAATVGALVSAVATEYAADLQRLGYGYEDTYGASYGNSSKPTANSWAYRSRAGKDSSPLFYEDTPVPNDSIVASGFGTWRIDYPLTGGDGVSPYLVASGEGTWRIDFGNGIVASGEGTWRIEYGRPSSP